VIDRHVPSDCFAVVCIRRAAAGDAAELARLRAQSLVEQGLLERRGAERFVRDAEPRFDAGLRSGRVVAWILASPAGTHGCAAMNYFERLPYPGTALHAELAGVYVEPSLRGRGYARALCRTAIAAARERGVRRIAVHAARNAGDLYRRLGFVPGNQLELT
jgi:GNAT superfamily N-acetyltransferase